MIKIGSKIIGHEKTFVIAEGGLNHNGDIKIAKQLVESALDCGADAIKFQTYKTENFVRDTNQYFEVFKKAELSFDEFEELKDYCDDLDIIFFSTPFDLDSVTFLNNLQVPCFKVASSDLTNFPLIREIAKTNKPMIISSGLATSGEIEEAVEWCSVEGNNNLAILHCVANYPTQPDEVNMEVLNSLKKIFPFPIGYSDNGESTLVDILAVSMGATIIEKHFTLNKNMSGPDHSFSIEPSGLKKLIEDIRLIEKMKGDGIKIPQKSEIKNKIAIRKSLTVKNNFLKGHILQENDISIKRPADGIEPKFLPNIIGKKLAVDIKKDSPINWSSIV